MPATGGEPRQLTDWPSQEVPAAWSPDGTTLAFASDRDATRCDLWTIAAAGGEAKRITHGNFGINASDVRWSPDGRTLYFIGASADGSQQVFRVPASGGTPRQLTHARGAGVDDPDVSPDGTQLAYQVIARGLSYVETVPVTGGPPRRFHADTTRAYQDTPFWSPDGSRIVFSDWNFATDHYNLALASLPGGEVRRLTTTTDRFEFDATWTHDGDSLVFISVAAVQRVRVADVSRLLGASPGR
jgi:Tol biopolymer transport system component